MEKESWELVDLWVADLLGLPASMVWQSGVTVGMHAGLGDYSGIVVLGRGDAVHVSLPDWAQPAMVDELAARSPHDLVQRRFWQDYERTAELTVLGPAVHAFTDTQLDEPAAVERIAPSDIEDWRDVVSQENWEDSGFAGHVEVAFAVRSGDEIAAASNLTLFRGVPSDVGVLSHPRYRGQGFSSHVARAATAYAVRNHRLARYRSETDNVASRAISQSLGFVDHFEQLAIRPGRTDED